MKIPKPRMSFSQIMNMNVGFLGIQYSFGLQQSAINPLYSFLGADPDKLPLLNLAGPLTGLLIQPIIGAMSDKTWHPRWGRRKPYFLIGAIFCSLCLFIFPFSRSLWMAAGLLWILDAANNTAMEPYRAFVADKLPADQQPMGFLTQSFFTGLGITLANFSLAFFQWAITGETHPGFKQSIPYWVFGSFFLGAICSITSVLWSVYKTPEIPPTPEELAELRSRPKGLLYPFKEIASAIGDMPKVMWQLALVYLFQWYAMFCYWQFIALNVAQSAWGVTPQMVNESKTIIQMAQEGKPVAASLLESSKQIKGFSEDAVVHTGMINGWYNIITFVSAFGLLWLAKKYNAKITHFLALLFAGIALIILPTIHDKWMMFLPMVFFGIAWASMMGVPYLLVVNQIPAKRYGVYMGIINMMIVIPMFIQTLSFGYVYKSFLRGNPANAIIFAGTLLVTAAVATLAIKSRQPGDEARLG